MTNPDALLKPGDPTSRLDADRRTRSLNTLRRSGAEVDVLVVGGGITGVGVALDAASRGLSVVLVERNDLAHGTSRWSSKLIHGGLRYWRRATWVSPGSPRWNVPPSAAGSPRIWCGR